MKFFTGGAKKKPPTTEESLKTLRESIDLLDKRELFLEKKINDQHAEAAKLVKTNRRGAMQALKLKKLYMSQQDKISASKFQLQQQIFVLEEAAGNVHVFNAMRTGTAAIKEIHQGLDADKIDDVMDDMREQMSIAQGISDVMTEPFQAIPGLDDEDDLLAELEELGQEEMDKQLAEVDIPAMPLAPSGALPTRAKAPQKSKEEEELEALSAAMGI